MRWEMELPGKTRPGAAAGTRHARFPATLLAISLLVVACVATPTQASPPGTVVGAHVSSATPTYCVGSHTWPPHSYPPPPAGLSAESINMHVVRLVNSTGRDYWYRISTWEGLDCAGKFVYDFGFLESEMVRGPLPKHSQVDVDAGSSGSDVELVRMGVGFWDHPCGEPCSSPPMGFLTVPQSTIDPGST